VSASYFPCPGRGVSDPDLLDDALHRGARAVITTPRGQNPTGASADPARGRAVLASYPDVLVKLAGALASLRSASTSTYAG
jgi:DNA-binding transcriptional MocR family regulator